MDDPTVCAWCGARACEAAFHACLAADFTDPGYGAVHHLVVAAYGLQHGWFTADVTGEVARFVAAHLDDPPTDHDRRTIREAAGGAVRVRAHHPAGPATPRPVWPLTVADVDRRRAAAYAATVRGWAASVAAAVRADRPLPGERTADG